MTLLARPSPARSAKHPAAVTVPLVVDAGAGSKFPQPVTVGVPFPRGAVSWPASFTLSPDGGDPVAVQAESLARWADGSVRWLLIDFIAPALAPGQHAWSLVTDASAPAGCKLVRRSGNDYVVDTGVLALHINASTGTWRCEQSGRPIVTACDWRLTDARGAAVDCRVNDVAVETDGPVRATVRVTGVFSGRASLRFVVRLCVFAGLGTVRTRLTLHNPRRARHRGGLWDLGDPGSILFQDLSLAWSLAGPSAVSLQVEPLGPIDESASEPVEVYQDSSGGERWNCRTHLNREGRVPHTFRGYQVSIGSRERRGLRANPVLTAHTGIADVSVAVPEFWQQFPKSLERHGDQIVAGLFPGRFSDLHELQGGEQKTHAAWLAVAAPGTGPSSLDWVHAPAFARATPDWYETAGAFPHLASANDANRLDEYLRPAAVSLLSGREVIDEYGWRHYGEVYADHEAALHPGPGEFVTHYNNQYDVAFGALLQYWRTGDRRWWQIADPLARHVADIDIYHTTEDKSAYNGGLFWFTDHYKPAGTATHRTYSRANQPAGRPYGGGPGSAHNFSSGLAVYSLMTGDPVARDAALSLADWVVAMDDGRQTVFGLIDAGPTGLASETSEAGYHGPGRGPGLSVNALLDGWLLSNRRAYLDKAEELIRRACHPADDVAARDLLNVELRWSYPVFLAALDRYLAVKAELGEDDDRYAYAQAALVRYAGWMADHEIPYFDQRERLEFPTETWAAQDFRKANVMRLAAAHADEPLRGRLLRRGREIADRAWADLLSFPSSHVARAVAIMLTEGTRDEWFRRHDPAPAARPAWTAEFGNPQPFTPQKRRVTARLRTPAGWARLGLQLVRPSTWRRLWAAAAGRG